MLQETKKSGPEGYWTAFGEGEIEIGQTFPKEEDFAANIPLLLEARLCGKLHASL